LIHAATMVTAGVYMIGRTAVLFSHAPDTLMIVAVIGAATALFAGTIGLVQNDIKRVLAYSTVSQLGLMFLAMGVGAFGAGIFHLYTHAFFKALLFLGSGAVIHALHGEQDIRNMGGLKKYLPVTYWTFVIGSLAIAGFPGLAGFFSKDEILFETFSEGHEVLWVIGALTSFLTATYMFRLVFLTFHGDYRGKVTGSEHPEEEEHGAHTDAHGHAVAPAHGHAHAAAPAHTHGFHPHDAPGPMAFALIVLAVGSVLAGYIGIPHALGGHNQLAAWLEPSFEAHVPAAEGVATPSEEPGAGVPTAEGEHDEAALEMTLMIVSSLIGITGIALAWFLWRKRHDIVDGLSRRFAPAHRLLLNKYYVDEVYDATVVRPVLLGSREGLWRGFDVKVIDGAVNGTASLVNGGAWMLRRLQTGSVRAYAGGVFVGVVVILGYYLWR
jgi:NADH-quinone oxidoreductase subunit L